MNAGIRVDRILSLKKKLAVFIEMAKDLEENREEIVLILLFIQMKNLEIIVFKKFV